MSSSVIMSVSALTGSMMTRQSKSAEVHGVRLGAGDNSFLVREDAIEVLRNGFEGLKVGRCCLLPRDAVTTCLVMQ